MSGPISSDPAAGAAADDASAAGSGGGYVQSLARGLAVIAAFDAEHPRMTLSDVARRADLSRAAARRFLLTLETLGYVRSDGREFSLTPQVMRLGFAYLSSQSLPDIAQPHLQDLSMQIGESTSVAVLDGDDIMYVARRATTRIMHVSIRVGTRFPAYVTSMGRVLLAARPDAEIDAYLARAQLVALTAQTITEPVALRERLEQVRELGYSLVDQELEVGLRSLAVPIRDRSGAVIAAANVSTSTFASPDRSVETHLDALRRTVARIESDLREQDR